MIYNATGRKRPTPFRTLLVLVVQPTGHQQGIRPATDKEPQSEAGFLMGKKVKRSSKMRKVMIRPQDIINAWETDDAYICVTKNGKKWVCERSMLTTSAFEYVESARQNNTPFVTLVLKGKSDCK